MSRRPRNMPESKAIIIGSAIAATAAIIAAIIGGMFLLMDKNGESPRSPFFPTDGPVRRTVELSSGFFVDLDSGKIDDGRDSSKELENSSQTIRIVESDSDVRLAVLDPKVGPSSQAGVIQASCLQSILYTKSYSRRVIGEQFCLRTSERRLAFLQITKIRKQEPQAITFEVTVWPDREPPE
jgi:hypothetical protein